MKDQKQTRQVKANRKEAEKRLSEKVEEIKHTVTKLEVCECGACIKILCTCAYNYHYHYED